MANSDDKILLQTINISKTYPGGIRALDKVSFELKEGEIHALLGENGAGKTTLIKILSGILHPDEGKILYNGVEVAFKNPLDAMSLGIGVVHQHPLLIPNFNVYENLKLYATIIRQQLKIEELTNLLKIFKVEKSVLDKKIADLPSSIRQKIEILKVLLFKPKVLFLDEPTSALTPIEVEELFNILKDLKEEKKSIVFVTHKIKEALKISDRITILRRGKKIATLENKGNLQEDVLATLIVGDTTLKAVSEKVEGLPRNTSDEHVLVVEDLHARDDLGIYRLKGFNMKLRRGEILAIVGVAGNGQKELVECLTGLRRFDKGNIRYFNSIYTHIVDFCDVVRKYKVSYITDDRIHTGIARDLDFLTNIMLRDICIEGRGIFIDKKYFVKRAKEMIAKYDIKAPHEKILVNQLSGGNIQKLIVARELEVKPSIIIAEQPTQGLDVKTTIFVRSLLLSAKGDTSILLITYDLEEALSLADRIIIMYDGKNVAEHSSKDIDLKRLSLEMLSGVT